VGHFFFMETKRPDNFVDNPGLLPYGSNIGAPSIKPVDLTPFKRNGLSKVEKVYESKYKFEPIVGEIYHLYEDSDGEHLLSLIEPTKWDKKHLYSAILNSDMTWTKLD